VVRRVAAHEDEGVWGCARAGETANVACGVPWGVEDVEGAVGEEVDGVEGAELEAGAFAMEVEFVDVAVVDVGGEEGRVGVGGEAGHECRGEAGTDSQGCGGGKA